ncbi:MAG: LLM class F420-dependent oxidoreductase [Acidimicrobiia bacterium]|nr:LLM class F420-dependent oxidoreductase [Acidimicrobiia bacterium]
MSRFQLTGTGVWSPALRYGEDGPVCDAVAELESLGYTAAWIPDVGGDVLEAVGKLLSFSSTLTIATGILNLWMNEPADVAARYTSMVAEHGRRFLVGIGVSHGPFINSIEAGKYTKPLTRMAEFLDGLDAAEHPLPADDRVLAALGPKMLELARTRTAGSHPYLVTAEHTAAAREALGPDAMVAPEQAVVLETDPDTARAAARAHLATYLTLPNYVNNWKRLGFTDEDLTDGGSDALVDALVAWGDEEAIRARVQGHHDAGADHVCIQVVGIEWNELPVDTWRRLAPALNA